MARLLIGTSGYSFKQWKGHFYPSDLSDKDMLSFYSRALPAVEINYTFRHLPSAKSIAGWAEATPPEFVFVLKASQRITHILRLKNAGEAAQTFMTAASGLGPKLGPVLFQLPPFQQKDTARLQAFLGDLPAGHRYAFEFRHPSWFDAEVEDLLRGAGASLCIAETEDGCPALVTTAPFLYIRLRSPSYAPAEIAAWGSRIRELLGRQIDVFAFFKHEDEGPRYAQALLQAAAAQVAVTPPE
ncbi:MAG TPA: DUF72 domain-containing protein [Candidatus Udaeobacter sp.]|nr:DUF72 domain-containing protein [Candidatus Udaeobacter sp.]